MGDRALLQMAEAELENKNFLGDEQKRGAHSDLGRFDCLSADLDHENEKPGGLFFTADSSNPQDDFT
jgi:hypothetical protein